MPIAPVVNPKYHARAPKLPAISDRLICFEAGLKMFSNRWLVRPFSPSSFVSRWAAIGGRGTAAGPFVQRSPGASRSCSAEERRGKMGKLPGSGGSAMTRGQDRGNAPGVFHIRPAFRKWGGRRSRRTDARSAGPRNPDWCENLRVPMFRWRRPGKKSKKVKRGAKFTAFCGWARRPRNFAPERMNAKIDGQQKKKASGLDWARSELLCGTG